MDAFLPPVPLLILSILYSTVRFENQRWARARRRGLRGSNQLVGAIVEVSEFLGTLYAILFLIAYWYDTDWRLAVGLAVLTAIGGSTTAMLGTVLAIRLRTEFWLWPLGTVGLWVLAPVLFTRVSWFGLI